jgi:hypothetical protein
MALVRTPLMALVRAGACARRVRIGVGCAFKETRGKFWAPGHRPGDKEIARAAF